MRCQQVRRPQLGHRVRAHLQLEAHYAPGDLGYGSRYRARAVGLLGRPGGAFEDGVQVGAGSHRRVDGQDIRVAEPGRLPQAGGKGVFGEADHLLYDLKRGVVRPGLLAEVVVVQLEEMLVELQVGVTLAAADPGPVYGADDADEQVEGDPEVGGDVVGEQLQRLAHQGVVVPERCPDLMQLLSRDVDALGSRQQQRERHGLGVPVSEGGVAGLRKQQCSPVTGQARERLAVRVRAGRDGLALGGKLVEDLPAQQPGQRRYRPDERADRRDRLRLPAQEVGQQVL